MTTAIDQARQEFAKREADRAATQAARLADARKMIAAVAAGDDPPASEIIRLCDDVGAGPDWFADALDAFREWKADQEAAKPLPAMRRKLSDLEAEAGELADAAGVAFKQQESAFAVVRNPVIRGEGDQFTETATAEDIATYRKAFNHWGTLTDQLWLARRDIQVLREQITELAEIASRNADPDAAGPIRFKLPAIRA